VPGTSSSQRRRIRRGPRPFQHPVFRRVWGVSVLGHLARFIDFTLTAWLVVQQSDSSSAVGLLIFFRIVPFLVLGPVIGTLLDRFSRIRIFRLSQIGMAITAAGFGIALSNDLGSLTVIYAYTSLMGVLMMGEIASRRAYVSGIVGPAALGSALALDMVSMNIAWFVGSNLGGLVAKLIDPASAYGIISAVFAVNYLALRGLPRMFRQSTDAASENPFKAFVSGSKFVVANKPLFAGLLVVGVNNFFGFAFESMVPAFARDVYDAGPTQFGLLMSAQGLGALVTALYIALRGRRLANPGLLLIGSAMIQAVGSIGFSFTQTVGIGFLSIAGLGLISTVFGITHAMLILLSTPPKFRGRVLGFSVLMIGMFPIGSLALGFAADAIGLGQAVRVFAATGLILLVLIFVKYPELRKPLGHSNTP
jgi:MFS family permease